MKVASIQLNSVWEDPKYNLERVEQFVHKAQNDGCDVVILPEMFSSGFSMNAKKIAEQANGSSCQMLCQLAQEHHINLIAGLVEKIDDEDNDVYQNVAVMIDRNGQIIARYIKNYPFSNAGEHLYYQAGNETVVYEIDGVKASTFICYDLRFPELFRQVAQQVEMMVVIASWPAARLDHWLSLLKARAIENQCFVVGVNRIGRDGNDLDYTGGSQVVDPFGHIISLADEKTEYQMTELNISKVKKIREQLPFLQDMK